jgi:uncharacterized phage protein gp47/JayE
MPLNRPTLQALMDRAIADISSRLPGADARVRRSNLNVLSRVHSGAMHELYGELDWAARQLLPNTCDDDILLRWANVFLKVPQKAASFAVGQVQFIGTNSAVIAAGTLLQRSDGAEYSVDADVVITAGTGMASVTAIVAGVAGNAISGTSLSLVSTISGVNSAGVVTVAGLTNGVDIESIPSVRARLLARLRQPPQAGADFDYVEWAESVPGITRAWCFPKYYGSRTVGICVVTDGAVGGLIPSPATVAAVQAYIDSVRPTTADATVFAPVADALNFTIALTPNTVVVQAAVQAELADLLSREAVPGGTLPLTHINQAISVATGETDHVLSVPAASVVSAPGHISVLGVITWL